MNTRGFVRLVGSFLFTYNYICGKMLAFIRGFPIHTAATSDEVKSLIYSVLGRHIILYEELNLCEIAQVIIPYIYSNYFHEMSFNIYLLQVHASCCCFLVVVLGCRCVPYGMSIVLGN